MNLLEELDGLQGENLASAALRFLVLQSNPCKNALLETLNKVSPIGPLTSTSHFSCYREYATSSEESGAGRLDLVLELDQAVVGIEAKLLAEFQPEQPTKYKEDIERLCKGLADVRRHEMEWFLIVLGPKSRSDEISKNFAIRKRERPREVFLSWETIFDAVGERKDDLDTRAEYLFRDLKQFVGERIRFIPKLRDWLPHLHNQWQAKGTNLQRGFLWHVRNILPNPGRLSAGESWVGYYFHTDMDKSLQGWIGFVDGKCLDECAHDAIFVMSMKREISESQFIQRIQWKESDWPSWRVNLDESWCSPDVWNDRLQEFFARKLAHMDST